MPIERSLASLLGQLALKLSDLGEWGCVSDLASRGADRATPRADHHQWRFIVNVTVNNTVNNTTTTMIYIQRYTEMPRDLMYPQGSVSAHPSMP
jgi:hypothetical protein